jgi:hypothetical protein
VGRRLDYLDTSQETKREQLHGAYVSYLIRGDDFETPGLGASGAGADRDQLRVFHADVTAIEGGDEGSVAATVAAMSDTEVDAMLERVRALARDIVDADEATGGH